jgi:tRNA(adenine34) deaminase
VSAAAPVLPEVLLAMTSALEEARSAMEAGEVPVGAVILSEGRLVVRSQNRMRRDGDPTAHAEVLALREASLTLGEDALRGANLVVTLEPCAMCAGAIVLARVASLVFGAWDDKAGMCGSVGDIVRHSKLNHQPQVVGGVMGDESARLLRGFFAVRR